MFEIFEIGRPNKKASLNLSINAIVIVVLAMTLLGLGLGFIRGMFVKITGISEATFQKISEQLNTDLATSEEPLLFSKTRTTIERGGSSLEGFGVRNDGNARIYYGIRIQTFSCPEAAKTDTDGDGKPDACVDAGEWFEYFKGDEQYSLGAAETQVNKVQINIERGAKSGLYLLKMSAYIGEWDEDLDKCEDDPNTADIECEVFGQTELFLNVA